MHDAARSRLPSHHISRPRLTRRCADARLVVIEAAGGYGKSVLAAEIVDAWGALPIWVMLEAGGVPSRLFVARLRAAVADAGLSDAAGVMAAVGDDPAGAVDALLSGLAGESGAIVIDDAHNAERDAAALIDRIARQLGPSTRLLVLARVLPGGLPALRRGGAVRLTAADLALRAPETLELCRTGFGLTPSAEEVTALDGATSGWTAAAVLAVSRSRRSEQPLGAVARVGAGRTDLMASILEEALSAADRDRAVFARIAGPPLLDRELLAEITGERAFLERGLAWGLPITPVQDGWWELPDAVREHLSALAAADPAVLRVAATHYQRRGELGRALQMLLASGQAAAAAELLDSADPWVIDRVDPLELLSVIDRIPPATLDRFSGAVLGVARCCAAAWLFEHSGPLLARLEASVDRRAQPELRRALDAELLTDLLNRGDPSRVEQPARRLLETAVGPGEQLTRARALTIVGQGLCWRRDHDGRLEPAALREAAGYLQRATELHMSLGNRPAAATISLFRAMWVELPLGRPQAALEVLDAGLVLAAEHPRRAVRIRFCRAYVLGELGREGEVEDELGEVLRTARRLGDAWMLAYVAWQRMISASLRGDAEATVHHARQTEAQGGEWWSVEGAEFLAEAADCLDRVGSAALAADCLERAKREPQKARAPIGMAEYALLARHGDPELALARLAAVHRHGIAPREYWRVTLLQAYTAFRLGDGGAGALAAQAFEQAAALGQPRAPLLRERGLTEALLALAADTGLPAAKALEAASLPIAVSVLGRFELTRGGRGVPLGAGQEARLLKLVAASGGRVHVEQAIEGLWPEVERDAGRNRLRTVLNRLRDVTPDTVGREGEHLCLGPDVRFDLAHFHAEAREALALGPGGEAGAAAIAQSAIARYRGALLPNDPYEEWAEEPRESARRTVLELLDPCAEIAVRRGDLDEARRMVERTIELAPYDDHRYLRVASILHEQGRKGAALSVLSRARSALAQLGIDLPAPLVELERTVAAGDARRLAPVANDSWTASSVSSPALRRFRG